MRKLVVVSFLILVVIANRKVDSQSGPPPGAVNFARLGMGPDGDTWLQWDSASREQYIKGFITGFNAGAYEGCSYGPRYLESKVGGTAVAEAHQFCINSENHWPRDPGVYANDITEFYQRFPTDHYIPMDIMLNLLSSRENLTIKQIHDWYISGGKKKP